MLHAKMLGVILALATIHATPERTLPPALVAFKLAWTGITGFDARVTIFEEKGTASQHVMFDYDFSKPSNATMHVVAGPNSGVTLVWSGGATVVAHRGSGLMGLFKKKFSLHDAQTTTLRGSSIDQLSFGAILSHAADTAGTLRQTDGPTIAGVATDEVSLVPANSVIDTGLTLEVVDVSKLTHLPVRLLGYEGPVLVRTIDFSNVIARSP